MDALDQAIWQRKTSDNKDLVHHSDRGSQYLSIKYTERLAPSRAIASQYPAGQRKPRLIFRSEQSVMPTPLMHVNMHCRAMDNALAECVIGLFKTEVINEIGPWKSMREVEWETLKWVDWYNNRRLLGPIHCPAGDACITKRGDTSPPQKQRRPSMQT
jgi:transposase InsO family protein